MVAKRPWNNSGTPRPVWVQTSDRRTRRTIIPTFPKKRNYVRFRRQETGNSPTGSKDSWYWLWNFGKNLVNLLRCPVLQILLC